MPLSNIHQNYTKITPFSIYIYIYTVDLFSLDVLLLHHKNVETTSARCVVVVAAASL